MRISWHRDRFLERATAEHVRCLECGKDMWLPVSKLANNRRCGAECQAAARSKAREEQCRDCETCGARFRPRSAQIRQGQGRFCSQACNTKSRDALNTPEAKERAVVAARAVIAAGLKTLLRGPANNMWRGGKEASAARQREVNKKRRLSGEAAAALRQYRAQNPEKVRRWHIARSSRAPGRVPGETVDVLGKLQRWKCAICRCSIRNKFHVDHIQPVSKGGLHEARNLQLLCVTCNLRKNARDPIVHMQSLGRLL